MELSLIPPAGIGYVLKATPTVFNPADATTYYWGHSSLVPLTTATLTRFYIPRAGTVKSIDLLITVVTALGTSETSTVSFRLNNTADTVISAVVTCLANFQKFSNTELSIAVVVGDYFEIKWVTPTWATNPLGLNISAIVYIE